MDHDRRPSLFLVATATLSIDLHGAAERSVDAGRYVLNVDGARVEFDDDFSDATLRRIIGVLRSC